MEITKSKEGVKIRLPPYKINIKKTKGVEKINHQYTCILPPLLCSLFQVGLVTPEVAEEDYTNEVMFYELEDENILISGNEYYKTLLDNQEHNDIKIVLAYGHTPKEELINYCENNPINFKLFDTIHYKKQYITKVYKLSNSNSYRLTLPHDLFKKHINHSKDNYILFTIDTTKEDLHTNKGVVTYEITN